MKSYFCVCDLKIVGYLTQRTLIPFSNPIATVRNITYNTGTEFRMLEEQESCALIADLSGNTFTVTQSKLSTLFETI